MSILEYKSVQVLCKIVLCHAFNFYWGHLNGINSCYDEKNASFIESLLIVEDLFLVFELSMLDSLFFFFPFQVDSSACIETVFSVCNSTLGSYVQYHMITFLWVQSNLKISCPSFLCARKSLIDRSACGCKSPA